MILLTPLLFLTFLSYSTSKLVLLFEYCRHGARSSEAFTNLDLYPEGVKKITAEGLFQHYLIGSELRERYVNKMGFLPEKIDPNNFVIKVYASALVRTYSSALSQLLGLYPDNSGPEINSNDVENILPPFSITPKLRKIKEEDHHKKHGGKIPATLHGVGIMLINQINNKEDIFFQGYEKNFCPKIADYVKKAEKSEANQKVLAKWRENLFPKLITVLERDWNVTGLIAEDLKFSDLKNIYDLYASLNFHKRGGYELHFDEITLDELKRAYTYVMMNKFETEILAMKGTLSLLVEDITLKIAMKMKKSDIPEYSKLKFTFYSGRDLQMYAFLVLLMESQDRMKLKDYGIVYYASVFLMELHERDEAPGEWFIKFWFNDVPLKMKCGEIAGECEIGRFLDLLKTAVSDNIYRDCGTQTYRYVLE